MCVVYPYMHIVGGGVDSRSFSSWSLNPSRLVFMKFKTILLVIWWRELVVHIKSYQSNISFKKCWWWNSFCIGKTFPFQKFGPHCLTTFDALFSSITILLLSSSDDSLIQNLSVTRLRIRTSQMGMHFFVNWPSPHSTGHSRGFPRLLVPIRSFIFLAYGLLVECWWRWYPCYGE